MTDKTLIKHIKDIARIQAQINDLKALIDISKAKVKKEMTARNIEKLERSGIIATCSTYNKRILDTKRLKAERPELAEEYTKETTETRLTVRG